MESVLFGLLVVATILLVVRASLVLIRKFSFEHYWQKQLDSVPSRDAVKLVVFGDSLSQGVGASRPQNSFVGRAAAYIATKTGRPVHIANYGQSGATAQQIINEQLPHTDVLSADIILLEVGVNDSYRRTIAQFEADMKQLFGVLPLQKTVVADIPFAKLRRPYQDIAGKLLVDHEVNRAYPSQLFLDLFISLPVTAGDFWHPNDKGYKLWFDAFRPGIDQVLRTSGLLKVVKK